MVNLINCKYLISSPKVELCPSSPLFDIAFIGRSNVGKSSVINMLGNQHNLAKISKQPGKTQMINHFEATLVNNDEKLPIYLVDLPGYGFAKVSISQRKSWQKMITGYFTQRKNLFLVNVLIDSRHTPQQIDIDFLNDCARWGVSVNLIFTKTDKINQREVQKNVKAFQHEMMANFNKVPPLFLTSAEKGRGRKEILDYWTHILPR
jgi:GTP-binding protein